MKFRRHGFWALHPGKNCCSKKISKIIAHIYFRWSGGHSIASSSEVNLCAQKTIKLVNNLWLDLKSDSKALFRKSQNRFYGRWKFIKDTYRRTSVWNLGVVKISKRCIKFITNDQPWLLIYIKDLNIYTQCRILKY